MSNTKHNPPLRNQWIVGWNIGRYGKCIQRRNAEKNAQTQAEEWQQGFIVGSQERSCHKSFRILEKSLRLFS
jgi:hypothetical protein